MSNHNEDDDKAYIMDYLLNTARTGNIETKCKEYLDTSTFQNKIYFNSGEHADTLELYVPSGSYTIQKILDEYQDVDSIVLRRPVPDILPITVSKIFDDSNSFVIPSKLLNIDRILSRAKIYQLEAVVCDINQRQVIFKKHLETGDWYYYQKDHQCEQLNRNLSENLNNIITTRGISQQINLINSAHFLVSMVFYNATKYIYKQEND